jgi:hypothetical protein
VFNHSATGFPLTGAHSAQQCASCHSNNVFTGLNSACVSCHLNDFTATTNPNHAAAGFPQDCQLCHGSTQWTGATFNHSLTQFPLTGAHVTVQCASCHLNNQFTGTSTNCYDCHRTEYTTVTDPNHVAAGFPTSCTSCHNTTRWSGATFTHNFPIYSGAHRGKWDTCSDCHSNPANYTIFSCTTCHEHDQTRMDDKHRDVRNYVYNSLSCYSCHPRGSE